MGFSADEVNELKEQFDLFDMIGEGELACSSMVSFHCADLVPTCRESGTNTNSGMTDQL